MNDEILKLAKECDLWEDFDGGFESIEAFYKQAFNAGLEAAAPCPRCEANRKWVEDHTTTIDPLFPFVDEVFVPEGEK